MSLTATITRRPALLAVLLLTLVPAAPSLAARDRAFAGDAARAARLLDEHQLTEARALVADLTARAPGEPEVRWLTAELALRDGQYAAAVSALDGLPDDALGGAVGASRRLAASSAEATAGMVTVPSSGGHFVIAYAPGPDETIAALAGDTLEAARTALLADLGYAPSAPVRVELLGSPSDLAKVSTLTEVEIETTGTIALSKYGKLMVVSPRATLAGYPWMDTLAHEYTHLVVSDLSHDHVPVWLQEGLARFAQVRWRAPAPADATTLLSAGERALLAGAVRKGRLVTLAEMHPSLAKLPSQDQAALAYAEVLTLVGWMHARVGAAGLRALVVGHATGRPTAAVVADVLGMSMPDVEAAWKASLRSLADGKADGGRGPRAIQFNHGGQAADQAGLAGIASSKARGLARLGGMLRARGHLAAAVIEYRKALAVDGTDDVVAGKLARTLVEAGQFDEAIAVATPLAAADAEDPVAAITLGTAYLAKGQAGPAAEALVLALRVNPFDPLVRCGLATAYATLRDPAQAREEAACNKLRAPAP